MTIVVPDAKSCIVEISQIKSVTEFGSLVGVRLFRNCKLEVDFDAKTAKGQNVEEPTELKSILESEVATLIELTNLEPDLHLATHRLLDIKLLLHLLLANPHYGKEAQKPLEDEVTELIEKLLSMDSVQVVGGCQGYYRKLQEDFAGRFGQEP